MLFVREIISNNIKFLNVNVIVIWMEFKENFFFWIIYIVIVFILYN